MMKERPILFSGPMVRALLDGRKTQTRRVVKGELDVHENGSWTYWTGRKRGHIGSGGTRWTPEALANWSPYGAPGDRLWVRERWGLNHYKYERLIPKQRPDDLDDDHLCYYATEGDPEICHELRWKPSIHMPRWASRTLLEIPEVRVERLNDISEDDAIAEGLQWVAPGMWSVDWNLPIIGEDPRKVYGELWERIHGPGSWAANPWVWAIGLKAVIQ